VKTRKHKTERQKLIIQLDKLSKDIVRQRDGNICQHCGKWCEGSNRQVSHVIPVSAGNKLRWDPMNMKILCYHCHINWWHKNPMESSVWFARTFPDRWEYIQANRGVAKISTAELVDKVRELSG
jgi:5-methylcytosine-specific restriction endonuclease McrA